jgi:hypothetical protein
VTADQYHDVCQTLRCLYKQLADTSMSAGSSTATIINQTMLATAQLRIWIESFGLVDIDIKRLNRRCLLALKYDRAVPFSARREIDVILKIRSLERVIDRTFGDVDDAGETGATHET